MLFPISLQHVKSHTMLLDPLSLTVMSMIISFMGVGYGGGGTAGRKSQTLRSSSSVDSTGIPDGMNK